MAAIRVEIIDTNGTEILVNSEIKTIPRIGETIAIKESLQNCVKIKEYQVIKVIHGFFTVRRFINEFDGVTIVVE